MEAIYSYFYALHCIQNVNQIQLFIKTNLKLLSIQLTVLCHSKMLDSDVMFRAE